MCLSVWMYVSGDRPEVNLESCSSGVVLEMGSLTWILQIWLSWLASTPQWSVCLLLQHWDYMGNQSQLFRLVLEIKLRSHIFKHITDWTISPALKLLFFFLPCLCVCVAVNWVWGPICTRQAIYYWAIPSSVFIYTHRGGGTIPLARKLEILLKDNEYRVLFTKDTVIKVEL